MSKQIIGMIATMAEKLEVGRLSYDSEMKSWEFGNAENLWVESVPENATDEDHIKAAMTVINQAWKILGDG